MTPGTMFRDPLKDGGEGPQMVVLRTGSFQMGSPATESGRFSDEGPARTVKAICLPTWLSKPLRGPCLRPIASARSPVRAVTPCTTRNRSWPGR